MPDLVKGLFDVEEDGANLVASVKGGVVVLGLPTLAKAKLVLGQDVVLLESCEEASKYHTLEDLGERADWSVAAGDGMVLLWLGEHDYGGLFPWGWEVRNAQACVEDVGGVLMVDRREAFEHFVGDAVGAGAPLPRTLPMMSRTSMALVGRGLSSGS